MALVHVLDHTAQMLGRLIKQYRGKDRIEALVTSTGAEVQKLEDALWQLATDTLDTAAGVQLDQFGAWLGEPRGDSLNDTEYRRRIWARTRINRSQGTAEDVIATLTLAGAAVERITGTPPASFEVTITGPMTAREAALWARCVRLARAAGVGAGLIYGLHAPARTFRTARSAVVSALSLAPVGVLPVVSTAGFPDTGTLLIDEADIVNGESIAYTAITATSFVLDGTTLGDHGVGSIARLDRGHGRALSDLFTIGASPDTRGCLAGVTLA